MRKTFLILSAIALVGVASCQKPENQNPDYNAETKEVLTQFVLNVSTGENPQTKMSAENVQRNGNFLGMQDAKMFVYNSGNAAAANRCVTNPGTGFLKLFDLGTLYAEGAVDNANNKTNRIMQLSIPTGSDAVLFYGKAINSNQDANAKTRGKTIAHWGETPASTKFDIARRIGTNEDVENYDATARLMIYIVNTIIDAHVDQQTESQSFAGYSGLPALAWKDLGHQYERNLLNIPKTLITGYTQDTPPQAIFADEAAAAAYSSLRTDLKEYPNYVALYPMEEVLGRLYYLFTHFESANHGTTTETITEKYRAGSSKAILNMAQSVALQFNRAMAETPGNRNDANAKRLSMQIVTVMQNYFIKDDAGNWNYKDVDNLRTNFDSTLWNTKFEGAKDINNYPQAFHIPEGAAQLAYTHVALDSNFQPTDVEANIEVPADHFYYLHPNNALVYKPLGEKTFDPKKYVYPAELYYYVNSGIRVTDEEVSSSDYPNGVNSWNTGTVGEVNKWTAGNWLNNGQVTSSTRGVAIRDNIQYAVAMLQTQVAWGTTSTGDGVVPITSLEDNRAAHTSDGDRTIPLNEANFELHGILIGGVHPTYNWQFIPRDGGTEQSITNTVYGKFDGVIYDDDIVSSAVPTTSPTYTLVYDNYDWTGTQRNVYVTLEFVNNGDAFWGKDNIIPAGGTFYLIGELKPDAGQTNGNSSTRINWDKLNEYNQVPPIYLTGDNKGLSQRVDRVFIQNVMTKVTFRIGKNSLKNAYYAIPDLKAAQMSLGLSVDISWQDGYTYDIEF